MRESGHRQCKLLCALLGAWVWGVLHRAPLIVDVLRDRNALYRETTGGIENVYTLKLVNKTPERRRYRLDISGNPAIQLVNDPSPIRLEAETVESLSLTLRAESGSIHGRQAIRIRILDDSGQMLAEQDSAFFAPP